MQVFLQLDTLSEQRRKSVKTVLHMFYDMCSTVLTDYDSNEVYIIGMMETRVLTDYDSNEVYIIGMIETRIIFKKNNRGSNCA